MLQGILSTRGKDWQVYARLPAPYYSYLYLQQCWNPVCAGTKDTFTTDGLTHDSCGKVANNNTCECPDTLTARWTSDLLHGLMGVEACDRNLFQIDRIANHQINSA